MADPRSLRPRVEQAVRRLWPAVAGLSQDMHARPELSEEEVRASGRLARFLAGEGFRVRRGIAGLPTAFEARKRLGPGGRRIAFLAEYDALPGIGHGCGHNLIGASAAGAGAALGRMAGALGGEVIVVGTPAEETIGGKVPMVERGVFDRVDAALMFHPSTENRVYTTSLACHSLEVRFRGRSAHAVSAPEKGINALDALIRLFNGVEALKGTLDRRVRIPGIILEGGQRANIVPDLAVGRFSLRAPDLRTLLRVEKRFIVLVRRIARATRARATVRWVDHRYAEMVTNHVMADIFRSELRRMARRTEDGPRKGSGSLDMGNVSHRLPSIHPYISIAPKRVPLHSAEFARRAGGPAGRAGLRVATRALALTGLQILGADGTLDRVRREFERTGTRERLRN